MSSRFNAETRGRILQQLYAGLTLEESCAGAGMPVQTVKNWLTRGRSEPESEHGFFAVAVDEARDTAARADMSLAEFRGHLNKAVRAGSVAAMKVWIELHDDEGDAPDGVDALRARLEARRDLNRRRQKDPLAELDAAADEYWAELGEPAAANHNGGDSDGRDDD